MINNLLTKPAVWLTTTMCLVWCMCTFTVYAQIKPIQPKSATRAVIVGISDYRNDQITDLRFADRDAQEFADFLSSAAGGNVPKENIKLLTNEKATLGQMVSALTWLKDESKTGDKAIVYFSGHGDMESLTGLSFLLAHDASANAYSGGGGFPVFSLQAVISILSTQKNVQVLLITDACRAGKLAGNEINGVQATAKVLSDQFANEVKVLSCQPNELSLESTAWGGGRGVFSYYLIDGLKGLADNNQDQVVTLLELSRYLEDQVPTATAPHSQIPMIVGNKGAQIAQVDPPTLALLQKERAQPGEMQLSAIASRSVSSAPSANDTSTVALIAKFEQALQNGKLLENGPDAYDYYQQLKGRPDAQASISLMRLNLAAKLQDEAQFAINDYLSGKQDEMQKRWQFNFENAYDKYPGYLEKSAELLGSDHFMYSRLKSRQHYFTGLRLRLKYEQAKSNDPESAVLKEALAEQLKAVEYDENAVFAYNEIGHLKILMRAYEAAVPQFEKAVSLSPTWVLPWSNMAFAYYKMRQYDKAEQFGLKALKLDSTFFLVLYNLGLINCQLNAYQKAVDYFQKALRVNPDYTLLYYELGLASYFTGDYQTSEKMTQTYVERAPNNPYGYNLLGEIASKLNKTQEAEAYHKKTLELDPNFSGSHYSLGEIAVERNDLNYAKSCFEKYTALEKKDFDGYCKLACVYVKLNDKTQAVSLLQAALEAGVGEVKKLEDNACFETLKDFQAYQELLKKYRK